MKISDGRTTTPSEFSIESVRLQSGGGGGSYFFYLVVSLKPAFQSRTRGPVDAVEKRKFPTELIISLNELQQMVGTLTDEAVSKLTKNQL